MVEREAIFRGDDRFLKASSLFEERLVLSLLLTSLYVESRDELKILERRRKTMIQDLRRTGSDEVLV